MTKDTKERATFLIGAAMILGFAFTLLGKQNSKEENKTQNQVTLVVATDLHYLAPTLTDGGEFFRQYIENGDGKVIPYCEEITEAFVEQVIAKKPNAVILSGDLTFNGEKESHIALAEKLARIEEKGIPVYVLPGNHDLKNAKAASFQGDSYSFVESIDALEFTEPYQEFGFGEAIARDENSLSYITELTPELWLLMVDVNTLDSPGTVKRETLDWVEQQLQEAEEKGVQVLAVSHQNLLQHNSLLSFGYMMGKNEKLLDLYEKYQVICNLSGHIHLQHIGKSDNNFPELVTSSLMVSPNQYGVLTLDGETAEYHTTSVDVAAWAKENGKENLADFAEASYTFMWNTAYNQAFRRLEGSTNAKQLSTFYADVNTAYFAGRMDELQWDEVQFAGWKEQGSFIASYLQSISEDGFKNHTIYSWNYK